MTNRKPKTANRLINEYIDTQPEFMRDWPLKSRMALRQLCDNDAMNLFFTGYSVWLHQQKMDVFVCD